MTNWTRAELKSRAKNCLRIYYWPAFGVSLVSMILTGGMTQTGSGIGAVGVAEGGAYSIAGLSMAGLSAIDMTSVLFMFSVSLFIASGIFMVIQTFFGNIISVGTCRFYMESRVNQCSAGIGRMFWGFTCGHYLNEVKIMFFMTIKIFLWSLLLIVPGVIKSYEYRLVPYILSENPGIDSKEAFAMSKSLMDGNKWEVFVLDLSFFGWALLASLIAVVLERMVFFNFLSMGLLAMLPVCFLAPYISATNAELYGRFRNL